MKKTVTLVCAILAFALIIAGAYFLYDRLSENYAPENLAGQTQNEEIYAAPDFVVVDESGKSVKLSEMKGKPVVLNLWASWCPPCKAEMPDFEKAYSKYKDEIFFMMVNMTDNQKETVEKAKAHIEENGYTFPVYYDTEYSAAIAYQASSIPMTFFIDKDGNLITYAPGMIQYELIEKGIDMIRG